MEVTSLGKVCILFDLVVQDLNGMVYVIRGFYSLGVILEIYWASIIIVIAEVLNKSKLSLV